jgi:uncharacterized membrane protein
MKYWKKILSLLSGGLKNLVYLIKERHDIIEVKILLIGLSLALLTGLYLVYLLFTDVHLYKVLSYTAIVHTMGGRALGIATCLSAGIQLLPTIFYNFLLEVVIVLICYGFVVSIMRNIIQPKLFRSTVRQAELTAQNQKTRVKKYGAVGLFLFVMFPFFMTGPVVGSIIGYLLNYKAINNFLIVFAGTLSSIVIYALIGNRVLNYINQFIAVDLVKKWGSIIVGVLIVIFLIYHMGTVKAFLDREGDDD